MKKINKNPQLNKIDYVDWIELIKFKETRNYVQRVLENYNVYRYILEKKLIQMINFLKTNHFLIVLTHQSFLQTSSNT